MFCTSVRVAQMRNQAAKGRGFELGSGLLVHLKSSGRNGQRPCESNLRRTHRRDRIAKRPFQTRGPAFDTGLIRDQILAHLDQHMRQAVHRAVPVKRVVLQFA